MFQKATSAFWAGNDIYRDFKTDLPTRFVELVKRVYPVALWGCCSWVWTRSTMRTLLQWEGAHFRLMIKATRRPNETFIGQVQRVTRVARRCFHSCGHNSLATVTLSRIFDQATKLSLLDRDGVIESKKILPRAMKWRDTQWAQIRVDYYSMVRSETLLRQRRGRPYTPWERVFTETLGSHLQNLLTDLSEWNKRRGEFINKAFRIYGRVQPERLHRSMKNNETKDLRKQPRVTLAVPIRWDLHKGSQAILLRTQGDNLTVVNWLRGLWTPRFKPYKKVLRMALDALERLLLTNVMVPSAARFDLLQHVYREHNP